MKNQPQPRKINLAERLAAFDDIWAPKIIARYNRNEIRLVKTQGEWVWHKHDETDELFLILEGGARDGVQGLHPDTGSRRASGGAEGRRTPPRGPQGTGQAAADRPRGHPQYR